MAERFGQQPGITQGDIGPRYTRKRLADEVYIGHYIKAGDRIRVRSTILAGVIASLTTVNLTIGGRVQGMDGDLVPFGDSFTFTADGVQTAQYVMAPEGYVVDLIVQSTSTGLTSGDLTVIVDIVQGVGSNAAAVGLLAFGYIYPAGLLGLNVLRNIGGGSGGGSMAIGGTVTSGTAKSILFVDGSGKLGQNNNNLQWGGGTAADDATTADLTGVQAQAVSNNVSGTRSIVIGGAFNAFHEGAGGTVSRMAGIQAFAEADAGIVSAMAGLHILSGSVDAPTATVPLNYGILVDNQAASGATSNWAIKTGTGMVDLGDVLKLPSVAIASLPATPATGMIMAVTDSLVPVIGSTVASGGSAKALVWYNGANWTVIGK